MIRKSMMPALILVTVVGAGSPCGAADAQKTAELKAGTKLQVTLVTSIDSSKAKAGEWFVAETAAPVMYGPYTLIPTGSKVHGVVDEAARQGIAAGRAGRVRIVFDRIETPDGRVIPISAGIKKDLDTAKAINKIGGSVGEHIGERELRGGGAGGVFLPLKIARAARKGEEFMNKDKDVVIPVGTPLTLGLKETTPVPMDDATAAKISDDEWRKAGEAYRAGVRDADASKTLRGAIREQFGTIREPIRDTRRGLLRGDGGE